MNKATSFIFRSPRLGDLDTLHDIEQKSFTTDHISRRRLRHWIHASNRAFLVCESHRAGQPRQIAGYLLIFYRRNSRRARLYSIVVSESFRGHGIARQLMAKGERLARTHGCSSLYLEVNTANRAAIQLYQSLGYEQTGIHNAFYEDGTDALRMEKAL